jgi:integrase
MVLSDRLRRINSANYRPRSVCSLRGFIGEWKPQVFPTLKYSTQKHYDYVIETHLLPAFGDFQLRMILREVVQNLILLKQKQGLSWKTVKHIRTVLGTVLGTAEEWGYIEDNPVPKTKLPRRRGSRPESKILTLEQLLSLLEALPEPSCSIVWLLVITGLRIGELLALRWRDIDFENRALCVQEAVYEGHFDDPKTRHSRRHVPLSPKCIEILEKVKPKAPDSDALVFHSSTGTPLDYRNLANRQLAPACKAAGLKRRGWHLLRHENGTLLGSVRTPYATITEVFGHTSPEMTKNYVHSFPADAREAVEKVEALLIGPKRTQIEEIPNLGTTLIQ